MKTPTDIILKLVSIAENSSINWQKQINYIENINDGRGYTISIVGFCTGTGDFIQVLREIQNLDKNHILVKFIPLVEKVDGTDSVKGLESLPSTMNNIGINDRIFNQAMWNIIYKLYWGPALEFCKKHNINSQLSHYTVYDTILNFGDLEKFKNITETNESKFLTKFLQIKENEIIKDSTLGDSKNNRVDMQKSLLTKQNFNLTKPIKVSCYNDNYTIN